MTSPNVRFSDQLTRLKLPREHPMVDGIPYHYIRYTLDTRAAVYHGASIPHY
jgi:hypothetical protein